MDYFYSILIWYIKIFISKGVTKVVEVKNLTKSYGSITAVDNISFSVARGEILGFLGPNGAGKSTTMNMITGYISSTKGTVTVDGSEILDNPRDTKRKIGYLPEIPPLYIDMTVKKYLEFMFELKKVKMPKKEHIQEVMKLVKIDDVENRMIKNLSKGYKQRVGFAQALLGNPPVLILDEPTVGLDPMQIIEIRNLIKNLGKRHTVILSSHVLSEISAICDRIIVISKGKLVADAKTSELSSAISGDQKLNLDIEGSQSTVLNALKVIPGVLRIRKIRDLSENVGKYVVEYENGIDLRKNVFTAIANTDCYILDMQNGNETLEDSFLKLTSIYQTEKVRGGSLQ